MKKVRYSGEKGAGMQDQDSPPPPFPDPVQIALTNTHETLQAQMWTRDILVSRLNHLKDEVIFENVESLMPFYIG